MVVAPQFIQEPLKNDEEIQRLVELYRRGRLELQDILISINGVSEYDIQLTQQQIDQVISDLQAGSKQWIEETTPVLYALGAAYAAKRLIATGNVVSVKQGFSQTHQEAVQALSTNVYESFFSGLEQLRQRLFKTLAEQRGVAISDILLNGVQEGETRIALKKAIVGEFDKNGVTMLVDRSGKRWKIEGYADMVARTTRTEIYNTGIKNRALENGFDLVEISRNGSSHEECRVWEGKVVSLTGQVKGYPTLDDAKESGIFHPNCKHSYTPISQSAARQKE